VIEQGLAHDGERELHHLAAQIQLVSILAAREPRVCSLEDELRVLVQAFLAKGWLDHAALTPPELSVTVQEALAEQASQLVGRQPLARLLELLA
jgi:hypothetical protein